MVAKNEMRIRLLDIVNGWKGTDEISIEKLYAQHCIAGSRGFGMMARQALRRRLGASQADDCLSKLQFAWLWLAQGGGVALGGDQELMMDSQQCTIHMRQQPEDLVVADFLEFLSCLIIHWRGFVAASVNIVKSISCACANATIATSTSSSASAPVGA